MNEIAASESTLKNVAPSALAEQFGGRRRRKSRKGPKRSRRTRGSMKKSRKSRRR